MSVSVSGQTDKQLSTQTITSQQKQTILAQLKSAPAPFNHQSKVSLMCDSLTVDTVAGNGFNGNMFDVFVATGCTLETFSVSVDVGTWNIAIFYKTGTFVGSESSATGWTFLDSASVTSTTTGAGALYKVPVILSFPLIVDSTYAFYVTATKGTCTFNYTNGTTVGDTASSNSYLLVKQGNGGAYPFSVLNSPRVFNGRLHYCYNVAGISEYNNLPAVELYPNPANQSVSVDLNAFSGKKVTLSILNTLGQRLQSSSLYASGIQTLNIEGYSVGLYFVQVEMNGKTTTSKLAVKY